MTGNEFMSLKASDLAFTKQQKRKQLKQQLTNQLMELKQEEVINILLEAVCIAGNAGLRHSGYWCVSCDGDRPDDKFR